MRKHYLDMDKQKFKVVFVFLNCLGTAAYQVQSSGLLQANFYCKLNPKSVGKANVSLYHVCQTVAELLN